MSDVTLTDIYLTSSTQQIDVASSTQQISVKSPDLQEVIVEQQKVSVSVVLAGPQGPPGAPGAPGPSSVSMNFEQTSPSDEWIINHNFGFFPNVILFTVGGIEMLGQVVNITDNQVRVYFTSAVAGTARLS